MAALLLGASAVGLVGAVAYKWNFTKPNPPPSLPVPAGKTRICVAGYPMSPPTAHAHYLADAVARAKPDEFETWYYFDMFGFWPFAAEKFDKVEFPKHLKGHSTSPFVWLENGSTNTITPIGGGDRFMAWVKENAQLRGCDEVQALAQASQYSQGMFHAGGPKATCARA